MRKQTPVLEWTIAENDAEWERRCFLNCAESGPVANRHRRLLRYFGRVTALLLLLVVAGGWGRRTPQDSAPGAAREAPKTAQVVRRAVAPVGETAMVSLSGDQNVTGLWPQEAQAYISLDAALHTAALKGHGDIILAVVEFGGGRGMAHVVTTAANGAPMHQQKRFYRRTPTGWRQTKLDAAFWGAERSLETPSFVYHFRANDAAAVMAAAPQVDALYTTLHRNFGLLLTPNAEKQVIEVRVTQNPGNAVPWFAIADRLIVPSPVRYQAPVELSDVALLQQSLALPLLDQVLAQARAQYAISDSWQPLLNGLRLWQVWDLDLPLADWREAVVTWLYTDLPTSRPDQAVVLPARYPALCAMHKLWLSSPMQIDIPLMCAEPDWEALLLSPWGRYDPLIHLEQPESLSRVRHPGDTVALATLIEYAVATYGRERLPALLAGLGQYESWETLLPAVYGVSATEFEAGWQSYLAVQYQ